MTRYGALLTIRCLVWLAMLLLVLWVVFGAVSGFNTATQVLTAKPFVQSAPALSGGSAKLAARPALS